MTDRTRPDTKRQRDLKLELTWVGKDHRPRLEPRILLEDPEKNYHAAARVSDTDQFENMLIFGDNLLALQSLATDPKVKGKVKCIYIDPPFNTGEMFEHYDDGLEHSTWLSAMRERAELLYSLLAENGTLFCHIDDNELAYIMAILDEIFGRSNRVSVVTFKQASATGHKAINPGIVSTTNFIIIYAKKKSSWMPNRVFTARAERDSRYGQFIENFSDSYEDWKFVTLNSAFAKSLGLPERGIKRQLGDEYEGKISEFVMLHPQRVIQLARPDYSSVGQNVRDAIDRSTRTPEKIVKLVRDGYSDIYLQGGRRILFYSDKLKLIDGKYVAGEPLTSLWDDILSNNLHNEGSVEFPKGKKPEGLIKRCIELSTNPGDIVLDSFAGSGTTGAVAHKMGRRWIMVELGEHAHTHIIPRMQKVIDGSDQGGISQAVGWKGGGGFRYFKLAPTLIKKDKRGNEIINPEYNAEMLAEACCKLKGFAFEPSASRELWWQQGRSSERDFLFVTTRYMDYASLQDLSEEVGPERTLLVLVKAYDRQGEVFDNLTLEKIPESVLHLAEWDKDDYSLKVENLPKAAPDKELVTTAQRAERRGSRKMAGVPDLFAGTGEDS
ncbi:site-specific DNA-methyltransferase [Deinococcus cavernae]|uniref:Site-specific DNA-methyltransferase n=1 Tax=Deinococcus cavernae TaxID=2320857 RepID=A0A418V9F5_9DEIO|nr:site-specific DNA-methyltransferase [Deinococcus cavernae]RJF72745.1 site-specific DNA-methyltransferase [Deinococcus cavernae]